MNTSWIVAGVLVIVVGFFAYQWFTVASAKKVKTRIPQAALSGPSIPSSQAQHLGSPAPEPPRPEEYPQVAGQSEGDLRQKEPTQRKVSDLPAGRAVESGGQGFSPEMAQNDGPVMGNGVFAFDGMEPTGFANF